MVIIKKVNKIAHKAMPELREISMSNQENERVETLDKETIEKIESAPIWVDEKVQILLLKTGDKPATDIIVHGEWSQGKESKHLRAEGIKAIEDFLSGLNLPFKKQRMRIDVRTPSNNTEQEKRRETKNFVVGQDEKALRMLLQAKSQQDFGKAYGYPETAVKVYTKPKKHSFMRWELPADVKQTDFYPFIMFRLSKENWQGEIKTAQKWAEVVKKNSSSLFNEYSDFIRDADSDYKK